jgi:hypothetical protein
VRQLRAWRRGLLFRRGSMSIFGSGHAISVGTVARDQELF